jgi:hypothetical protein
VESVALNTELSLRALIEDHWDDLEPWKQDYFSQSYELDYQMPQFYITAKIHKKMVYTTGSQLSWGFQ